MERENDLAEGSNGKSISQLPLGQEDCEEDSRWRPPLRHLLSLFLLRARFTSHVLRSRSFFSYNRIVFATSRAIKKRVFQGFGNCETAVEIIATERD
ncbi:hypothetical protein NPIL_564071 [Nephila pilipes]|uniref:Uncharacterized protein n=1 Tax=Nephila pilipes TaxID=299642 RepID=A0A8X6PSK3_NEPPI|nr:hypothetical protein NPIL_564071 [Nephila pilipes]